MAWTHPRHRSPWVAIAATLALTALLGLLLGPRWDAPAPAPFPYVQMMAITVTIAILTAYILVALSGMRFFWRTRQATDTFSMPFDIIVPLVAIAFCGCTIYESVHPLPASPVGYGAWIVPIWVAIGLVILLVLNLTNPERVRRFGSILGDGGTTGIT